jgi:transposase-like protein
MELNSNNIDINKKIKDEKDYTLRLIASLTSKFNSLKTPSNRVLGELPITSQPTASKNVFELMKYNQQKRCEARSDAGVKAYVEEIRSKKIGWKNESNNITESQEDIESDEKEEEHEVSEYDESENVERRLSYKSDFKLTVVKAIKNKYETTLGAAKKYNVPLKTLQKWVTTFNKNGKGALNIRRGNRGVTMYPKLETDLAELILKNRNEGNVINMKFIQKNAHLIAEKHGYSEFSGSNNYFYGFFKRNDFVVRQRTTTMKSTEEELGLRVFHFLQKYQKLREENYFDAILNMDETGIYNDNQVLIHMTGRA